MLVFAHRGASADAPENTLLAIQTALDQNTHGIEIDVQQVGNELVVFHDRLVDRNTNGHGPLENFSLAELQALDAGQGQRIPTLWQVLELIDGKSLLNLEIKAIQDISLLVQTIKRAVQELNFTPEKFIVSSFDHHSLVEFQGQIPEVKIGALTASNPIGHAAFAEQLNAYSVNIEMSVLNKAFVQDAKQRGLKIMVYTVDDAQELQKLVNWQIDYVFSNTPGLAIQTISNLCQIVT